MNVWTGDAMDHDAPGQASVIPGRNGQSVV